MAFLFALSKVSRRKKPSPAYQSSRCMTACVRSCMCVHKEWSKKQEVYDKASLCPSCLSMSTFQSLFHLSSTEEVSGGFHALIIISLFPLSVWLLKKKGEWHFHISCRAPPLLLVRTIWGACIELLHINHALYEHQYNILPFYSQKSHWKEQGFTAFRSYSDDLCFSIISQQDARINS